jgi:hypothetical protein
MEVTLIRQVALVNLIDFSVTCLHQLRSRVLPYCYFFVFFRLVVFLFVVCLSHCVFVLVVVVASAVARLLPPSCPTLEPRTPTLYYNCKMAPGWLPKENPCGYGCTFVDHPSDTSQHHLHPYTL